MDLIKPIYAAAKARWLGLASGGRGGLLSVGASRWTVALGETLNGLGVPIIVVDRSATGLKAARLAGLPTLRVEVLSVIGEEVVDLRDVEHVLAATADDAYNALVCTRFAPDLGRERVHQLATGEIGTRHEASREWRGKIAIDQTMNYQRLADLMQAGASFVVETHDAAGALPTAADDDGWPVAIARAGGKLVIFGPDHEIQLTAGDIVVRLYRPATGTQTAATRRRWSTVFRRRASTHPARTRSPL